MSAWQNLTGREEMRPARIDIIAVDRWLAALDRTTSSNRQVPRVFCWQPRNMEILARLIAILGPSAMTLFHISWSGRFPFQLL